MELSNLKLLDEYLWGSEVTVTNRTNYDLIAIYKYKGKIVGYDVEYLNMIDAKSIKTPSVYRGAKSAYDSLEHVITDCREML